MTDLIFCVDYGIPTGTTEEDVWEASRRWGSVCTHLGIQDSL